MICAFCGTDNNPENKFCGMCGVRLEQRAGERRVRPGSPDGKCPSCGHVNDPEYKFCGKCGSRIERRINERRGSGSGWSGASSQANTRLSAADARWKRSNHSSSHDSATDVLEPEQPARAESFEGIHGPSFLGLNESGEGGSYLLEEEGSTRRGLLNLVLLAIFLALVGYIVVQWRSVFMTAPRPWQTQQQGQKPDTTQPPTATARDEVGDTTIAVNSGLDSKKDQGASAAKEDAEAKTAVESSAAGPKTVTEGSATFAAKAAPPAKETVTGDRAPGAAKRLTPEKPPRDEATDVTPKPSGLLLKAQQYLQGASGVPQNCEQGLVYLRAAAQKNDPAAAVQMGALYSSGHCVRQDRVMAWRWFNSAHELEPGNQLIKSNLEQLWAKMTVQERRQAGR